MASTKATLTTGWEAGSALSTGTGTDARGVPNTLTGSSMSMSGDYGVEITVQYKNGGTIPTAAAVISALVSTDGTNYFLYAQQTAGLVAYAAGPPVLGVYSMVFSIPAAYQNVILYAGAVTGTGGMVTAQATHLTAI